MSLEIRPAYDAAPTASFGKHEPSLVPRQRSPVRPHHPTSAPTPYYEPSSANSAPPPPYEDTPHQPSLIPEKKPIPQYPPLYEQPSSSSSHSHPLLPLLTTNAFNIYLAGKFKPIIMICNDVEPDHQVLYTCALHTSRHPHILITTPDRSLDLKGRHIALNMPPTPQTVAQVDYHGLKSDIELSLPHGEITMISRGWFKAGYHWPSPSRNGETLTWKGVSDGTLEDGQGRALAHMRRTEWAWKKMGKLEIKPEIRDEGLRLEILISSLSLMEERRRRNNNSAAASGSSAGAVSVAVAC